MILDSSVGLAGGSVLRSELTHDIGSSLIRSNFFFVNQNDKGLEFKLKYSRSNGDNEIGVNTQFNT